MRILLKNPKKFFDEILEKDKISLRKFSEKIKTNYSNLKQYRRREKTIPKELFDNLVNYSPNKNYWLENIKILEDNWGSIKGGKTSGRNNDMTKVRSLRRIPKIYIKLNEKFCEFYGALMGDGCICKYKDSKNADRFIITISGNKRLDKEYIIHLKESLIKEYNLHSKYYEFPNQNTNRLTITNKELCLILNREFNFPLGKKYPRLRISNKVLKLPWKIKKYVIRGLFDTDGCILANKRESYRYPWVIITSKDIKLLNQIKKLLKEQGYSAYITGKDVCVRGIKNLEKWFKDIGSSNSRNLLKYEYFLKHKFLPAGLLN